MERVDLYAVRPDEFVAARNALVKALKAAGEKDLAGSVAKLRRPSTTAWALNSVSRDQPALVDAVLSAGEQFAAAARTGEGIRDAQNAVRDAVESSVNAAIGILDAGGHGTTDRTRQLLAGTLRAAIADEEVAALLRSATLATDHEEFGLDSLVAVPTPKRPPPPPPPPAPTPDQRLIERAERLEAEAAALLAKAAELRRQALC
jgi:hypothetical protein